MAAPLGNQYAKGNPLLGRPTKLTPEVEEAAAGYVEWCRTHPLTRYTASGKAVDAFRVPTVAGLARHICVSKNAIYKWAKENQVFSDVLDDLHAEAERMLSEQGVVGNFNPLMSKFLLSADHGKAEKSEVTLGGSVLGLYINPPTDTDDAVPKEE